MYKSFEIKNFKCFEHFKLDNLARVNLIAGKNNVGKTALLEALYWHSGAYSPLLGINLKRLRGFAPPEPGTILKAGEFWNWIFKDLDTSLTVELVSQGQPGTTRAIYMRLAGQQDVSIDSNSNVFVGRGPLALELECIEGKKRHKSRLIAGPNGLPMQSPQPPPPPFKAIFETVGNSSTNHAGNAERFGQMRKVSMHGHLVQALAELEPRLNDLTVIPVDRTPMIHGDIGLRETIALADMGGGMVRLASLLLATYDVRGGIILIDEIENGFHYSVLEGIWKAIARTAGQFDVQVFATTHSYECIAAASRAFRDGKADELAFYRLAEIDGKIENMRYRSDSFEETIQNGWEVR